MKRYILKITIDGDIEDINKRLEALGCEIHDVLRAIRVINFSAKPELIETIESFPGVSVVTEDRKVGIAGGSE